MNKLVRIYRFMKALPRTLQAHEERMAATDDQIAAHRTESNQVISQIEEHLRNIEQNQSEMNRKISILKAPQGSAKASAQALQADNHLLDGYYYAFEEKFRGTEEMIYERLKASYSDLLKEKVSGPLKKLPVIDIGCGRGELLKLCKELDLKGLGIDLNEAMVEQCHKKGYEAVQIDAIEYLRGLKSASVAGITGIHLAEHIPFEDLMELFQESLRVLAPGGFILMETPNPENLTVGAFSFWHDSSHLKPIPPAVLAFMMSYIGFHKTDILRLHPARDDIEQIKNKYIKEVARQLYGPRDYAALGFKFEGHKAKAK